MRQSERSRQWLIEALLQLMEKKPFHAITITDIAQRAGVSRLTFYRNFESKEAILRRYYDDEFNQFLETIDNGETVDLAHALTQCCAFWQAHSKEKKRLIQNDLMGFMFEPFDAYLQCILKITHLEDHFSYYQRKFIVGGFYSAMLSWIESDQKTSPEAMAKELLSFQWMA